MLKAALILEGVEFERTHDLVELCRLLPSGWQVKNAHHDLERITDFATKPRYPEELLNLADTDVAYAASAARETYDMVHDEFVRRGILR